VFLLLFWKTKIFRIIISAYEPIAPDFSVVALNASNSLIQIAEEKKPEGLELDIYSKCGRR